MTTSTHPIYFTSIFSDQSWVELCKPSEDALVVVTDDCVGSYYAQPLLNQLQPHCPKVQLITVPTGEASKSRQMKTLIEDTMLQSGCKRDTLMIALGGGMITDLTGFVAATYCRGIPVIYIPTSLLAMVDAALGGKNGINTEYGKNTLGTFTQPLATLIDVTFLESLSNTHYIEAFSEIIKHALIDDADYLAMLESHIASIQAKYLPSILPIIKRSCEIKLAIVANDEKELNKRESLNFGHTLGHALEKASGYQLSHGKAVAMGLIAESYLCYQLSLLTEVDFKRIKKLILNLSILKKSDLSFSKAQIKTALSFDKKNKQQRTRWVLLSGIGQVKITPTQHYAHFVEEPLVDNAIDYLLSLLQTI